MEIASSPPRAIRLVGIAGCSGSGKTTLASRLRERLGSRTVVLRQDCYYRDRSGIPPEERDLLNFDHPEAFDEQLLTDHLSRLKQGMPIPVPQYDFRTHTRTAEVMQLEPAPIVLVEGILLFHSPHIRDLFDYRIYVEASDDICLTRRLLRDLRERGRTVESVIAQYVETVRPMQEAFIKPGRGWAHLIVPSERELTVCLDILCNGLVGTHS